MGTRPSGGQCHPCSPATAPLGLRAERLRGTPSCGPWGCPRLSLSGWGCCFLDTSLSDSRRDGGRHGRHRREGGPGQMNSDADACPWGGGVHGGLSTAGGWRLSTGMRMGAQVYILTQTQIKHVLRLRIPNPEAAVGRFHFLFSPKDRASQRLWWRRGCGSIASPPGWVACSLLPPERL